MEVEHGRFTPLVMSATRGWVEHVRSFTRAQLK